MNATFSGTAFVSALGLYGIPGLQESGYIPANSEETVCSRFARPYFFRSCVSGAFVSAKRLFVRQFVAVMPRSRE